MSDSPRHAAGPQIPSMIKTSLALVAVRRVIRAANSGITALAQETGLTTPQLLALQALAIDGQETIDNLASTLSLKPRAMATAVRKLEKRGLVLRCRSDKDTDTIYLSLTDGGKEILRRAPQLLQTVFLHNFAQIPDWEQSIIILALEKVADLMNAPTPTTMPERRERRPAGKARHH